MLFNQIRITAPRNKGARNQYWSPGEEVLPQGLSAGVLSGGACLEGTGGLEEGFPHDSQLREDPTRKMRSVVSQPCSPEPWEDPQGFSVGWRGGP